MSDEVTSPRSAPVTGPAKTAAAQAEDGMFYGYSGRLPCSGWEVITTSNTIIFKMIHLRL